MQGTHNTAGNITSFQGTSFAYNDAAHKHAVTHVGGAQKYWYDAAGNVTRRVRFDSGQDITLSYDHENRLTGISGGATASYVYDGDGKLVKKTIAGTTTALVGNYYELTGGTAKKHYYAGNVRVAVRVQEGVEDTLYWLLTDHLGSTAVTTWSGGSRNAEVRYMPFGLDRYEYGTQKTDYRFTGQRIEDSLDSYAKKREALPQVPITSLLRSIYRTWRARRR